MDQNHFTQYRRTSVAEMRPATEDDRGNPAISISQPDIDMGSPRTGDMIARNPTNHDDQWLVAAEYFAANFAPMHPETTWAGGANKETSSRVSTIAASVLGFEPVTGPNADEFNELLRMAKTLAGSALSQDETPGQGKPEPAAVDDVEYHTTAKQGEDE